MKTAQQLKEDYENKLKKLQEKCKHKDTTWLTYMWAIGHSDGEALICLNCEKILDRRNNWKNSGTISTNNRVIVTFNENT